MASLPGIQRRLAAVCDVKDIDEESYVRLSDVKLLEWLRRKTDALTRHLQESKLVGPAPAAAAAAAAASLGQFDEPAAATPEGGEGGNPASEAGIEARAQLLSLSLVCDCLPEGTEQAALLASYAVSAEAVAATRKGSSKAAKPAGQADAPSWHAEIEGKDAFSGGALTWLGLGLGWVRLKVRVKARSPSAKLLSLSLPPSLSRGLGRGRP